MAEGNPGNLLPTDAEGLQYAKALYGFIWQKFGVINTPVAIPGTSATPSCDDDLFKINVGKAVICEQILTRDYLKNYLFPDKQDYILADADTAHTFCKALLDMSRKWDFFKRLFRYSALIAEFFLFRHDRLTGRLLLNKAPLIWNAVFKKYFAEEFYDNLGWQGMSDYADSYMNDIYPPFEGVISQMETPYDEVKTQYVLQIPDMILGMPETKPEIVYSEMFFAFRNYQQYFAWKLRPETPPEVRHEADINEDSGEGSGCSKSSDSSRSGSDAPDLTKKMAGASMQTRKRVFSIPPADDESDSKKVRSAEVEEEAAAMEEEPAAAAEEPVAAAEEPAAAVEEPAAAVVDPQSDQNPRKRSQAMEISDDDAPPKPKQTRQADSPD